MDIVAPMEGDTMWGEVSIVATATPLEEVRAVEFSIVQEGVEQSVHTDHIGPFQASLDTTELPDGTVVLRATATRELGETATDEIQVRIDNAPPRVAVISPAPQEVLFVEDGTAEVEVVATDGSGVDDVSISVGGQSLTDITPSTDDRWIGVVDLEALAPLAEAGSLAELPIEVTVTDLFGRPAQASLEVALTSRIRWTAPAPGPVEAAVAASPDGEAVYVITADGALTALSMDDGSTLCRSDEDGEGLGAPAVTQDGEVVYFGTTLGLRAVAGAPHCEQNLWGPLARQHVIPGIPAVIGTSGSALVTTSTGNLVAFTAAGAIAWTDEGRTVEYIAGPTLAMSYRLVITVATDGIARGIEADADGWPVPEPLWSVDTGGGLEGGLEHPAVVFGDRAYVGTMDGRLYCIELADGDLCWDAQFATQTSSPIRTAPVVDRQGFVYFGAQNCILYRLSPTPEVSWTYECGSLIMDSTPVLDDSGSFVYFCETGVDGDDGIEHGILHAVDSRSGEAAWTLPLTGYCEAAPVLVDGTLVVGTRNNAVYAVFADSDAANAALRPGS